jgi:hypothetical protein
MREGGLCWGQVIDRYSLNYKKNLKKVPEARIQISKTTTNRSKAEMGRKELYKAPPTDNMQPYRFKLSKLKPKLPNSDSNIQSQQLNPMPPCGDYLICGEYACAGRRQLLGVSLQAWTLGR